MNNKDFDFWLNEYYEKFSDYFSTENYACDTERMIEIIKGCIANGEQVKEKKMLYIKTVI